MRRWINKGALKPDWEKVVSKMDAEGEIVTSARMLGSILDKPGKTPPTLLDDLPKRC